MATVIILVGCFYGYNTSGGPVWRGHRDGEIDGCQHRARAPHRHDVHPDLLGIQPSRADRRLTWTRLLATLLTTTSAPCAPRISTLRPRRRTVPAMPRRRRLMPSSLSRSRRPFPLEPPQRRRRAGERKVGVLREPDPLLVKTSTTTTAARPTISRPVRHRVQGRAQGLWLQQDSARPGSRDPGGQGLDDPRPVGTGQIGLHQAHGRPALPDQGDVVVQGQSVPNLEDDDLFELRKRFGVLFQDGALFGSMNLYDNVAFPLRQHTDKGEAEIREIVERRLNQGVSFPPATSTQRAVGRHAQARRPGPRARARSRHRAL